MPSQSPDQSAVTPENQPNPDHWDTLEGGRLSAMLRIARAAGDHTLRYFGDQSLTVDAKSDDSPVTIADREAEQLVRREITAAFSEDTVQGEEFAEKSGQTSYRWVVDPIDGTKSFVCGVPLYSTLLALEKDGQPIGGVILIPALQQWVVAGIGHGCWHQKRHPDGSMSPWTRARVSNRTSLDQAVLVTSQVDSFDSRGAESVYKQLEKQCWITRTWGDGYGYLMVATGRADVMVDPICNAWDVAAILPVVCEAGGQFTDWKGERTVRGGDGVGTNAALHSDVLKVLACQ